MKFIVSATSTCRPERLVKEYPCICDYDHEVEQNPVLPNWTKMYMRLNSLGELIEFLNKVDEPLIISKRDRDGRYDADFEIEIYDRYRE